MHPHIFFYSHTSTYSIWDLVKHSAICMYLGKLNSEQTKYKGSKIVICLES